ncbi:cell division cycle protein 16 homolog [Rhopilema esculentum]|uniref:cell division cycle protein 16 homolog n=1 Tax=Rhopilema esculentum TaxID=499914 RepID=UPI0031D859E8|eukprot:gene4888-21219_t
MDDDGGKLDLAQLRNLVRTYIDNHLYHTALFWADKACSLSSNSQQDIIWLAQTMLLTGQYERAAELLKKHGLVNCSPIAKYIVAKCYAERKEWDKVLDILENDQVDVSSCDEQGDISKFEGPICGRKIESAICLLKGMAYEGSGNSIIIKSFAADAFKEALRLDVYCFEAFDFLTAHNMMTAQEELDLIESLPFSTQCSKEEADFVRFLYESKIKQYCKPVDPKLPNHLEALNENLDVVTSHAVRHFNSCDFKMCYKLSSAVMTKDQFHESCLPVHISCLVELKKKNELYHLASRLVNNYPKRAISWHAVGAYYLLTGRSEAARRYFGKATGIDRVYAPAWLGFAHSYANDGEHDQAISAYFTASELMPGSHLPYFYLGLEYITTNNIKLARHFFREALKISPDDPFVKHELGCIDYQNGNYKSAKKYFEHALKRLEIIYGNVIPEEWEPLFSNLGHVCRKLGNYKISLHYHKTALNICPNNASTYSAIGLSHCYLGSYVNAISAFHKALSIHRDDTISQELLVYALNNAAESQVTTIDSSDDEGLGEDTDRTAEKSTIDMDESSMMEEA